jgi:hypothetical protein
MYLLLLLLSFHAQHMFAITSYCLGCLQLLLLLSLRLSLLGVPREDAGAAIQVAPDLERHCLLILLPAHAKKAQAPSTDHLQ